MTITKITKTEGDLSDSIFCKLYWTELAQDLLLNGRIIKVQYLNNLELKEAGWYNSPVALLIRKGKKEVWVYPMMDDEGNDGGALATTDKDLSTIPVLREV